MLSVDLPSVDLPSVDLPSVDLPVLPMFSVDCRIIHNSQERQNFFSLKKKILTAGPILQN
jgi:hypothetical protein